MMTKKTLIIIGISLLFLSLGSQRTAWATNPHLFLTPATGSYSGGFQVKVKIDTGGKSVGGVDVHLEYPKNLVQVEEVVEGGGDKATFSELYSKIDNDQGKLRLNAYFSASEAGSSYTGSDGVIATINFMPIADGTAEVSFICSSDSTTESNIVDKISIQDIIVCGSNIDGSYTLTSSGSTAATATPTSSTGSTATPTPPVAGSVTQTISLVGLGILTILTGLALAL